MKRYHAVRSVLLPLAASLAVHVQVIQAQVVSAPSGFCGSCEATISMTDFTIATIAPVDIALDARGRYWIIRGDLGVVEVVSSRLEGPVQVGRRGQGPREFMGPSALIQHGDSMWVADSDNARLSLVGPGLSIARTVPFSGAVFGGLAVSDSVLMLNAIVRTPAAVGQPLHLVDTRTGEVTKSFGSIGAVGAPGQATRLFASIVENATRSGVLVAYRSVPVVQEWDFGGEIVNQWSIDAPWLRSTGTATMGTPTHRPNPVTAVVLPISETEIGLGVWVVRDNWDDAWAGVDRSLMELPISALPPGEALWLGGWMEIDLEKGEVTHSAPLPFLPREVVDGMVLQFEDTIDPRFRFWSRNR